MAARTEQTWPVAPDFDVVIIGAGLSGIDAAYRLQTLQPTRTYTILEARTSIGGTWDLFGYPGVRSDSDLHTYAFPFQPWPAAGVFAAGPAIKDYLERTARTFGIDRRIQFGRKVVAADFDTATSRWTLRLADDRTITCGFLFACAGYYDYRHGHCPDIAGLADFAGAVVHPQFWPEDLDHRGKTVVVIGSGATAVTLIPAMAPDVEHITMLQRSPTWIAALPATDRGAGLASALLPARTAHRLIRAKNIALSTAFYEFSRRYPRRAGRLLTRMAVRAVGDERLVAEHFTPEYEVWDQRVCVAPDGDLFKAIRSGRATVVTGRIDRVVPGGIRLVDGRLLDADVIVTATGLELRPIGGITLSVDGQQVSLPDQYVLLGAMLTGVPNFAMTIGYVNASWTLRADLTARLVCRILRWMDDHNYTQAQPRPHSKPHGEPLLDLTSGYIRRAARRLPQQGRRAPWRVRQNYPLDAVNTLRTDLDRYLRGRAG